MKVYQANNLKIMVDKTCIIEDATFSIEDGQTVAIFGDLSEASKLLSVLYLDVKPIDGEIFYFGQNLLSFNKNDIIEWRVNDVAQVNSHSALFSELNVLNNIHFPMVINRKPIDAEYEKKLFSILSVSQLLNKEIKELDNYEYLKILIARSMIVKPFVLLMDDVDDSLSDDERYKLVELINSLNNNFKTTIIKTIKYQELGKLYSKVIYIEDKKLRETS